MKCLIICAVSLLLATRASADYVQLSRVANLKTDPSSDADVKKNLSPPLKLVLVEDKQTNGYYHVRDDSGVEGWVYRTLGRRFAGNIPASVGATTAGSHANTQPAASEFEAPASHVWVKPTKTNGCKSTNGLPDPACTPGEVIDTEDETLVCSPDFRTGTVRDHTTSSSQKNQVYPMYGEPHPANNSGSTQSCEIDHLVALQLGGADTMANLWPECSPGYEHWQGPGFRDKDGFENYLWFHVCKNRDISLKEAQIQIAVNWRRYWELAGRPDCRNRQSCESN